MVDTVVAYIRTYIHADELYKRGWRKYRKMNGNEFSTCFYRSVAGVFLTYYPRMGLLRYSASLPKLLHGHNATPICEADLGLISIIISKVIRRSLPPISIPDPLDWYVSRIDYCQDVRVGVENKQRYIEAYRKMYLSKHIPQHFPTTVFLRNKTAGIRIYDKAAEIRDKKIPNWASLAQDVDSVIRFEIQLRGSKIRRTFGKRRHLREILTKSISDEMISSYLAQAKTGYPLPNKSSVEDTIKRNVTPSMASRLLDFIRKANCDGVEAVRDHYCDRTFQHYCRIMGDLGLGLLYLEDSVPIITYRTTTQESKSSHEMATLTHAASALFVSSVTGQQTRTDITPIKRSGVILAFLYRLFEPSIHSRLGSWLLNKLELAINWCRHQT